MNRYFGTRTITSSDRGYTCHYLEDTTINAFNGPGIRRALQQLCGHNRVGLAAYHEKCLGYYNNI